MTGSYTCRLDLTALRHGCNCRIITLIRNFAVFTYFCTAIVQCRLQFECLSFCKSDFLLVQFDRLRVSILATARCDVDRLRGRQNIAVSVISCGRRATPYSWDGSRQSATSHDWTHACGTVRRHAAMFSHTPLPYPRSCSRCTMTAYSRCWWRAAPSLTAVSWKQDYGMRYAKRCHHAYWVTVLPLPPCLRTLWSADK